MRAIIDRIKDGRNFVVTSHVNPDGDNVGSSVAMTRFLNALGKRAVHVLEDEIPDNLQFLLEDYELLQDSSRVADCFGEESYDVIALDSAEKNRIAVSQKLLDNASCIINIDHHMSNIGFGDLNYVQSGIGSTCEVLCDILREFQEDKIDSKVATALYTGLSTDTGNFMFSSVNEHTFYTAAFLTHKQADRNRIANEIYRNNSFELRVLTKMVLETFRIVDEVGIVEMTEEMLKESGVEYKDTDPIANIPIDTKGVAVGILIKEKEEGVYKISIRSKGKINVCEIAAQFGGGGHFNAAGCTITGSLEDAREKLQEAAAKQIQKDRADAGK
ncbi:MAG: bifunctional oligoribonuclease/PAP phosphatase NrnA [Peptostreptococcaceae bacterium]|nr:bifunctional oligoribonuclease/PAP phosphatase NrnA [Peptostreptococcaceae bacterium]